MAHRSDVDVPHPGYASSSRLPHFTPFQRRKKSNQIRPQKTQPAPPSTIGNHPTVYPRPKRLLGDTEKGSCTGHVEDLSGEAPTSGGLAVALPWRISPHRHLLVNSGPIPEVELFMRLGSSASLFSLLVKISHPFSGPNGKSSSAAWPKSQWVIRHRSEQNLRSRRAERFTREPQHGLLHTFFDLIYHDEWFTPDLCSIAFYGSLPRVARSCFVVHSPLLLYRFGWFISFRGRS